MPAWQAASHCCLPQLGLLLRLCLPCSSSTWLWKGSWPPPAVSQLFTQLAHLCQVPQLTLLLKCPGEGVVHAAPQSKPPGDLSPRSVTGLCAAGNGLASGRG